MSHVAIGARLRAICLALPEASEELMRRGASYRVADRIFALERPCNDRLALWRQVPAGSREIMLEAEPARFFTPPYFGPQGLDRRRSRRSGGLAGSRSIRPSQLSAGRAKAAGQARGVSAARHVRGKKSLFCS
jgi:hypothetical protein